MRRIIVVLILLLMMVGLDALKVTDPQFGDPLTLAAIGFVLLAAFSVAELGAQMTLPRVTGYIVSGILLGPYVLNILSGPVVMEMSLFNTLALGLIALNAGLELSFQTLRNVWKTLFSTIFLKILLLLIFVGGTVVAIETTWHFLLLPDLKALAALALLISVLAIGTSPAIAVAVVSENRSKGRLSDLVLGAAVLKDVVVVVCLALAISMSKGLLQGGEQLFDLASMKAVLEELFSSLLAGIVLGGLLVLYLRYIRAEMLLFILATILAVSEFSAALHLELLLVFIVAGAVLRNFSHYEEVILKPLERVALPVFVVFFTIAGANLNLPGVLAVLPLAAGVFFARCFCYYFAARWGGAMGGETPMVRRLSWMAYLPQAGVTVGLVGLAARQIPQLQVPLMTLGMGMVAMNLLVGPIALRFALKEGGEIPEPEPEKAQDQPEGMAAQDEKESPVELQFLLEELTSPKLREILENTRETLNARLTKRLESVRQPLLDFQQGVQEYLKSGSQGQAHFQTALNFVTTGFTSTVETGDGLQGIRQDFQNCLGELPKEMTVIREEKHFVAQESDSRIRKIQKAWLRLVRSLFPDRVENRTVPVRVAAKLALEEALVNFVRHTVNQWYRVHCLALEKLRMVASGDLTRSEAAAEIVETIASWDKDIESQFNRRFLGCAGHLVRLFENAGTFALPVWRMRLSEVEPKVRRATRELQADVAEWPGKLDAVKSTFRVSLLAEYIEGEAISIIGDKYFQPVETTTASIREELATVKSHLKEFETKVSDKQSMTIVELRALGDELRGWTEEYFSSQRRFQKTHINHYLLNREIALMFNLVLPKDVEQFTIVAEETPAHEAARPRDIAVNRVHLRGVFEQHLVSEVLPLVEDELEALSSLLNASEGELRESVEVATYALDVELSQEAPRSSEDLHRNVVEAFERAIAKLDRYEEELRKKVTDSKAQLGSIFHQALERFRKSLVKVSTVDSARSWVRTLVAQWLGKLKVEYISLEPLVRRAGALVRMGTNLWNRNLGKRAPEFVTAKDAGSLRRTLAAHAVAVQEQLPAVYQKLFSLEPLRDRRFFVVNRTVLELIRHTEREWSTGEYISGILVDGAPGSGRSSLLNVCQLELVTDSVVRLDDSLISRRRGLLAALGQELGTSGDPQVILNRLKRVKTVVLIDNLDEWLRADPDGILEIQEFFQLVVSAMGCAFWVVTLRSHNVEIFESLFQISSVFSHRKTLPELSDEEIQSVVEARHRVSGMTLDFERQWGPAWLGRMGVMDPKVVFFRLLKDVSGGNLRHALTSWTRSLQRSPLEQNRLRPEVQALVGAPVLDLDRVPRQALVILGSLVRFGATDPSILIERLKIRGQDFKQRIQFLEMSGLVERGKTESEQYQVPMAIYHLVYRSLKSVGIL